MPSGSRIPVDYGDPEAPVLAVRLQEVFGLAGNPPDRRGRVPLTLHLLSPAHRPVQVTRDLAGFWRNYVLRGAEGPEGQISQAPLAGRPPAGGADPADPWGGNDGGLSGGGGMLRTVEVCDELHGSDI